MVSKFFSKKVLVVLVGVLACTTVGSAVYAGTAMKKIIAYQNAGITIKVNGSKVNLSDSGKALYPITYDGTTYVPAAPVAKAMGGSVSWNAAGQSVDITTKGSSGSAGTTGSTGTTPSSTDSVNLKTGYTNGTAMSKIFEDNKNAASYAIRLYASAIQTGDTKALKAWMRTNSQKTSTGKDYYDDYAKDLDEDVAFYRDMFTSGELATLANDVIAKAKAKQFSADSKGNAGSNRLDYWIDIEIDGMSDKLGLSYYIDENYDTGKTANWGIDFR
ncbi:stalk domain-containing protein [Paenibacillus sp. MMS18-CY102]|uniref:stalk domain-containing protein n=1 Tax=Paenibacillus sp. MMS18-CY102 TaxID=2682849 RepID=UPI00136534AE|nr:stalk domain-containing protein [Paenibacillus sp. MMS18-CY102]MWC29740.1 hypothetical protein [Paenibacillus sp. MMS18-CY102]